MYYRYTCHIYTSVCVLYCESFVSCQILTAGANTKIALWDMERPDPVCEFVGHHSEVMG